MPLLGNDLAEKKLDIESSLNFHLHDLKIKQITFSGCPDIKSIKKPDSAFPQIIVILLPILPRMSNLKFSI